MIRAIRILRLHGSALAIFLAAAFFIADRPALGAAPEEHPCLSCHGTPEIATASVAKRREMVATDPGATLSSRENLQTLFVDPAASFQKVHVEFDCVSCHPTADKMPHAPTLDPPVCTPCHPRESVEHQRSQHGPAAAAQGKDVPTCWSCHGSHNIRKKQDPASPTHPANTLNTCGACHPKHLAQPGADSAGGPAPLDRIHERPLPSSVRGAETVVAATCTDCHGHHEVQPADAPAARISRTNVGETCGRCHAEIQAGLDNSVHDGSPGSGKPGIAVCTDCHVAHPAALQAGPKSQVNAAMKCASCHEKAGAALARSRHAQVAGTPGVASPQCWDCHGAHDIRRKRDPASKTFPPTAIRTCGSCHAQHMGGSYRAHDGAEWVASYMDSVHGRAIARGGPIVAATCSGCHDHHDVRVAEDPESKVHRDNIPQTCGKCHGGIQKVFDESVHAEVGRNGGSNVKPPICSDCHLAHRSTDEEAEEDKPRSLKPEARVCAGCHPQAAALYNGSIHATASAELDAPACWDCHGAHGIRRKNDPEAKTYPPNVIKTCGGCHAQHMGEQFHEGNGAERVAQYMDSVHGRAIARGGPVVAATCGHCHGHHDIRPSADPKSKVNHENIPHTCGQCHGGIEAVFAQSVHAEVAREGNGEKTPPVCTDCHSGHEISHADTPEFLRDIVSECGSCHANLYESYRESYHGKVQQLGSKRAAKCSDCHGWHNIQRAESANSSMCGDLRVQTCARCHPELHDMSDQGRANFASYKPHADFRDKDRDPLLFYIWNYFIVVMGLTFTAWGLHTAAWMIRGAINRARSGPRPVHKANPHAIQRFTPWQRWTHALAMTSFLGLTMTGLPLKFSDRDWAGALMGQLGGPHVAGIVHRCFASMVLLYLMLHLVHLWRIRKGSGAPLLQRLFGPNSMLPSFTDVKHFCQMIKWFFGRGPKPKFDRYTYWEKFDYLADVFGTLVIGGTGLLLCFPTFFAEFLPGYSFNVATLVHGYEALLAAGFIFTVHFFNGHLRWEKFPVDKVIFTGQLPEEEFREERPAEYERLLASGGLEALRVKPASKWLHFAAGFAAIFALLVGIVLVIFIVLAWLL